MTCHVIVQVLCVFVQDIYLQQVLFLCNLLMVLSDNTGANLIEHGYSVDTGYVLKLDLSLNWGGHW